MHRQQQRVGQRLGVDHAGFVQEHQRLREACAGAHEFNHLLLPGWRNHEQLDLADNDDMERIAGLADAKDHVAALETPQLAALCQALAFGAADVGEQGQHRQEAGNVEVAGVEHGGIFLEAATHTI